MSALSNLLNPSSGRDGKRDAEDPGSQTSSAHDLPEECSPAIELPNASTSPHPRPAEINGTNNSDVEVARAAGAADDDTHGEAEAKIKAEMTEIAAQGLLSAEKITYPGPEAELTRKDATGGQRTESVEGMGDRSGSILNGHPKAFDPSRPKPQKSSTKNEGQHTDKRYLCYVCNKLFTRRRSVRDHISKIHGSKTWEPARSLEIIVDPATGEPVEPLERQLYKAAAKPAPVDEEDEERGKRPSKAPEEIEPPDPDGTSPAPAAPPPSTVRKIKSESSVPGSRASSVDNFTTPAPVAGKKRPAPSTAAAGSTFNKKGTAKVKNANTPNKKPKLVSSDGIGDRSMFRSPSVTPTSAHHKLPASKLKQQSTASNAADSPTPPTSSRAASASPAPSSDGDEDDEDDYEAARGVATAADTPRSTNSDGEVFCICRKGDNHTWMIACDGGCEEWFHGRCVDIRERDGDLIDKYMCPNCQMRGGWGHTTWKRMCRRKGCRKPARVLEVPPSKYCSADCGRKFFVELVMRGDERASTSKSGQYIMEDEKQKKRRKIRRARDAAHRPTVRLSGVGEPNDSRQLTPVSQGEEHSEYETDSSADDDELPNRGGALRAGEVRAIADRCKTIEEWRALGAKPAAPPGSTPVNGEDPNRSPAAAMAVDVQFDQFETVQLAKLVGELAQCERTIQILGDREKLLDLIKERSAKITEEVKKANPKASKELCGYDPRLSWTEEEFLAWRDGEGKAVLAGEDKLGPPPEGKASGGRKMTNGDVDDAAGHGSDDDGEDDTMPTKGGVCVKNRCQRHGKWTKMQLAEVRFEQDVMGRKRERLRREEAGLRGRAVVRMWERRGAQS